VIQSASQSELCSSSLLLLLVVFPHYFYSQRLLLVLVCRFEAFENLRVLALSYFISKHVLRLKIIFFLLCMLLRQSYGLDADRAKPHFLVADHTLVGHGRNGTLALQEVGIESTFLGRGILDIFKDLFFKSN